MPKIYAPIPPSGFPHSPVLRACGRSARALGLSAASLAALLAATQARAEPNPDPNQGLDSIIVTATVLEPDLPDVVGTRIYAGKRASLTLLEDLPPIEGRNLRAAFSGIPGLLVSEVSNGSWASVSYRGLGEPHESWNLLTLQDGVPVSPDPYNYPAAYFTPPLEVIDRLEFVRGGAGLLYGPLPGGVLNYISRGLSDEPGVSAHVKAAGGSDSRWSVLGQAGWSGERLAMDVYGHQSEGDGSRAANSQFEQSTGRIRAGVHSDIAKLTIAVDGYIGRFGEPGGLSLARYLADRRGVSTSRDEVYIRRLVPSMSFDWKINEASQVSARAYVSRYDRTSSRQAGGSFGQVTPAANVLIRQRQSFTTIGVDLRGRRDFSAFGGSHTLTLGTTATFSDAPVFVDKGRSNSDRESLAGALARTDRDGEVYAGFAELKLDLNWLTLTPGVRLERVSQSVREKLDLGVGSATGGPPGAPNGPLSARTNKQTVALWGLGAEASITPELKALANVSRGFKPKLFNDGVSFQAGVNAADTFESTYATQAEAGLAWDAKPWLRLEASGFFVRLEDQIGLLAGPLPAAAPFGSVGVGGARRVNVGTMENYGVDLVMHVDFVRPEGGLLGTSDHRVRLDASAQLLEGEFKSGPAKGFRPQYAPKSLVRVSVGYEHPSGGKANLLLTHIAKQNGSDNARPEFAIPASTVVDASAEWPLPYGLSAFVNVNNLLDERYIARIRPGGGGGIDPGLPRNFSAGLSWRY
jgi:Fe(3+) dicitrate transport protein